MDSSWESVSMGPSDLTSEEDLDKALENMTFEDVLQTEQQVQTDSLTEETGVNTDPDWESQLEAMSEHSSSLVEEYNSLMRQLEEDDSTREKDKEQLQKKKAEAIRQQKALLDKLKSVRVKLQLNDSKATRKNFLPKKQEMILEKNKAEEEKDRLAQELEDTEKQLTALIEEKTEEQQKWQEELEELKQEVEEVRREAEEATLLASQNETAAVERQREVAMAQIEGWQREVEQYLNALRVEFPQQYHQERQSFKKKFNLVQKTQAELQKHFEEVLQKLQQGHELDSLPRIDVPSLPQIPTLDLKLKPATPPAPPQFRFPYVHQQPHPPPPHPQYYQRQRLPPPHHHLPPQHFPPPPQPEYLAQMGPSSRATPPPNSSPSPPAEPARPALPSTPPPGAASATETLEKLGSRFPQCDRAQLISLLKQVRSSHGTLARMPIDEATEHVRLLLLARGEAAPGPIGRPPPHNPGQRPLLPATYRPAGGGHAGGSRKFCLICQNPVDRESRYPLSCSHTIHRECIKTWLQTSKENSCPFCLTNV